MTSRNLCGIEKNMVTLCHDTKIKISKLIKPVYDFLEGQKIIIAGITTVFMY